MATPETSTSTIIWHLHNYGSVTMILIIYLIVCHNLAPATATEVGNGNLNGGFVVQLIRRNSPNSPFYNRNNNRSKAFRHLMSPSKDPNITQSEIKRDTAGGEGAQLMKLSIGTPPHEIYAVADTGSTIAWTQCEPCPGCYKQNNPMFDPKKSSTYRAIPCDAPECVIDDDDDDGDFKCSSSIEGHKNICSYNLTYLDGSNTKGVLAKETITLTSTSGKPISLKNIVIGCGHNNTAAGVVSAENEMGVFGLGYGNLSFVSQIAPYVGGRKFSHCFVPFDPDHPNVPSMMSFGNGSEVSGEGVASTPLIIKEDNERYRITVEGISVEDKFVSYNSPGTVLSQGNMFLDSGTEVVTIPQGFYDRLIEQVKTSVQPTSLKPIQVDEGKEGTMLCYNTSTAANLKGPTLTVHFGGGAKQQLAPAQAFTWNQKRKLLCFIMMNDTEANNNVSIYGNYAQSNVLIGFDLDKKMVSFKPTDCTKSTASGAAIAIPFSYFFTYLLRSVLFVILTLYRIS